MSAIDVFQKPTEPRPPAPPYHSEEPKYACDYGASSWDNLGEPCWLPCTCEDPVDPWPPMGPTDGPRDCDCYYCSYKPRRDRGREPCESFNHHCPMCHDAGICTWLVCQAERKETDGRKEERHPSTSNPDRA